MTSSPIAKQYEKYLDTEAAARKLWDQKDRELKKLVRLAKLGRKTQIVVPISDTRGVRITDKWREGMRDGLEKLFTKAFNHRHEVKEVALSE